MAANSALLPALPLADALSSKAPLSLSAYVTATTKLEGRDKLTKIIQYGSRFWWWFFLNAAPHKGRAEGAHALYRLTQMSRKAFRMAKLCDELVRIMAVVESREFPSARAHVALVKSAAMAAFWTYDNLNYLTVAKVIEYGSDRANRGFSRSWFVANVCMVWLGAQAMAESGKKRQLLAQAHERATAKEREALTAQIKAANVTHFNNCLALFKALCDLTCSANMPGMDLPLKMFGRKLNDGVIGAIGCLSGLTVIYNCWPERAKAPADAAKQA